MNKLRKKDDFVQSYCNSEVFFKSIFKCSLYMTRSDPRNYKIVYVNEMFPQKQGKKRLFYAFLLPPVRHPVIWNISKVLKNLFHCWKKYTCFCSPIWKLVTHHPSTDIQGLDTQRCPPHPQLFYSCTAITRFVFSRGGGVPITQWLYWILL